MMFYATAVINFPYDKTLETIRLVAAYSNPRVLFETEVIISKSIAFYLPKFADKIKQGWDKVQPKGT